MDRRQGAQLLGTKRELLGPRLQVSDSGDVGDAGNDVDPKWQACNQVGHQVELFIVGDSQQPGPRFGHADDFQPPADDLHGDTRLQPAADGALEGDDPGDLWQAMKNRKQEVGMKDGRRV